MTMARLPKDKALEHLRSALDEAPRLKSSGFNSSHFQTWKTSTTHRIGRIFRHKPEYSKRFGDSLILSIYESWGINIDRAISLIESMIEEVEDEWPDPLPTQAPDSRSGGIQVPQSDKVFVIHGHDQAARETIARFLERLQLEPVILHEQSNEGRTIIEKFEDYADVGFAVVLLTPDDTGASKRKPAENKDRARQNVVFEFGYFVGTLGRNRVCALVKGDIEKPSDLDGVVYIPLGEGDGWKLQLVRELRAAGFAVDANLAL